MIFRQPTPVACVLEAQETSQPSSVGPRKVGRKSPCSSPGLGNLSAPNGEGENRCGGLGIILVLGGAQGGLLVCLGVQRGAAVPEQGFSFPAGQQGESRCLFGGNVSAKGFPCSTLPCLTSGFAAPVPGGRSEHTGLSLMGLPGLLVTNRDFLLCVWMSYSASPITCRAGCPRAGGSPWIPASASLPMWCSQRPGIWLQERPRRLCPISRTPAQFSLLHPV